MSRCCVWCCLVFFFCMLCVVSVFLWCASLWSAPNAVKIKFKESALLESHPGSPRQWLNWIQVFATRSKKYSGKKWKMLSVTILTGAASSRMDTLGLWCLTYPGARRRKGFPSWHAPHCHRVTTKFGWGAPSRSGAMFLGVRETWMLGLVSPRIQASPQTL